MSVEYKIVENKTNIEKTEEMLNALANQGWKVISFTQYQICLERKKDEKVGRVDG